MLVATDGLEHGITRLQNTNGEPGRVTQIFRAQGADIESGEERAGDADRDIRNKLQVKTQLLGVSIRRNNKVVGALVLHRAEHGNLSAADEALLLTISMQVAMAIRRIAYVQPISEQRAGQQRQVRLSGVSGASGIAIGSAVFPALRTDLDQVADHQAEDTAAEEERFRSAVNDILADLQAGQERLSDLLPSELRELFDVYAVIATDSGFIDPVIDRIRAGQWAPSAIRDTVAALGDKFSRMEDERLQVRAEDVRAVGRRLLLHLYRDPDVEYPDRTVLVGSEISLARMAEVPAGKLAGIVSFEGSTLSHTALLARSLGIPAVMGIGHLSRESFASSVLVVDGYQGRVFANPTATTLREFQRLEREEIELAQELRLVENDPSLLPSDVGLRIRVNISFLTDLEPALRSHAAGVGLYRTEFPFMLRDSLPDEKEQTEIYRQILEAFSPAPVVIRTLDVGGDKPLSYLPSAERNPFLGARGIRLSLEHPEVFTCQIRAMLRASEGLENLHVLLPMVSTVSEVIDARALIKQASTTLAADGVNFSEPSVGVMIEVPSVLYQIQDLAQHVDFFSIGSNDLTQYLMASARENPDVAGLHDHFQPAVLRAIDMAISAAHAAGRKISVCGELASDPGGVALLLGMGVDELSVSVSALGRVKHIVSRLSKTQMHDLVKRVLPMNDVRDIKAELTATMEQAGLGGLVRAGR
jgi:phosphotransferase system enzyme I (PtsP)